MGLQASFSAGFRQSHDVAVIIACDANYLPYAATPALALASSGFAHDVLIGSPDPFALPLGMTQAGIGQVTVRDDTLIAQLPLDSRRSLAAYMHVFLGQALCGQYRRILVIDADILYQRGDPARLLNADMLGRAVAAVRDNRQWRTPDRRVREFEKLGVSARPYFNSGVVMVDTQAFVAQDLPARVASFAKGHLAGLGRDQALINGVLQGDWAEISPLWNWQFTTASAHLTSMADPCLVHFIGTRKPWSPDAVDVVPMRMREAFAEIMARHFPDLPPVPLAQQRGWPDPGDLRKALFRQLRAAGPMLRYLQRFPDEYTLLDPNGA